MIDGFEGICYVLLGAPMRQKLSCVTGQHSQKEACDGPLH